MSTLPPLTITAGYKTDMTAVDDLTQMSALVVIVIPPYKSTISGDR